MKTTKRSASIHSLQYLPLLFGGIGLVVSAAYQAQRCGVFLDSFHSLDRFIQYHLDAIAGLSSLSALFGLVAGFIIARIHGQARLLIWGTVFSFAVLLWTMLGLSL